MMVVKKMKAIYHTLNFFNLDISNECFIGECWIPTNRIIDITKLLLEVRTYFYITFSIFVDGMKESI